MQIMVVLMFNKPKDLVMMVICFMREGKSRERVRELERVKSCGKEEEGEKVPDILGTNLWIPHVTLL